MRESWDQSYAKRLLIEVQIVSVNELDSNRKSASGLPQKPTGLAARLAANEHGLARGPVRKGRDAGSRVFLLGLGLSTQQGCGWNPLL